MLPFNEGPTEQFEEGPAPHALIMRQEKINFGLNFSPNLDIIIT